MLNDNQLSDVELRLTEGMPGAIAAGFILAMRKDPLNVCFDTILDERS